MFCPNLYAWWWSGGNFQICASRQAVAFGWWVDLFQAVNLTPPPIISILCKTRRMSAAATWED